MENPLYQALQGEEAPQWLYGQILKRIAMVKRFQARMRIVWYSLGAVLSGIASVPTFFYASHELYVSGFYDYVSLAFSDHAAVLASWQNFGILLLESLPALALLMLFVCAGVCLWLISRLPRNARDAFGAVGA